MSRKTSALQVRDFRMWFAATFGMSFALQMIEVIIGWSVYSHHRSAIDLGWIGLAEFIPLFVLALPAGHLADRFPRRYVLAAATTLGVGVALALAAVTAAHVHATLPYFALALGAGTTMAIGTPATRAMGPTLVPRELIPNAMTLRSFAGQGAAVIGPAVGGLVYGASATAVYLIAAAGLAFATVAALSIGPGIAAEAAAVAAAAARRQAADVRSVLEGLVFLRHTPIVLGAILLDLFAVLFGGAVALLPIFAAHYLRVGATGLGVLRAGPAAGALLGAAFLIRRPIMRHAGRLLLSVVAGFGASMIVFGLSRNFELSLVALLVSGFLDMFSMNIRSTTSALATPDGVRGRVTAVETVFISASNQLGAFESGLAASLVGTIPAVVGGGCMTIAIALSWWRLFPALGGVDQMNELEPVIPAALALTVANGAN
ncbi:MAG TPA: MFS transporter [Solirubrobacteraceae bacterium]|nr:MFS transporter [Solirubrobacteraceae bacterium]